jgi:hypothetical protein
LLRTAVISDGLLGEPGDREEVRSEWLEGDRVTAGDREVPLGLTRTADGRTMAAKYRETRTENASRSGRILADRTEVRQMWLKEFG